MTVLPYLPVLDVYIAFNPNYGGTTMTTAYAEALPASGASNAYWTNVSEYLLTSDTREGRQHFLDRMEAGSLKCSMNARDGFFYNGAVNATGYTISPRQPIAVTMTWSGTTYSLFFGVIDSAKEVILDELNSELSIEATDMLKQLSLRKMESPEFWSNYTHSASVESYYSLTTNNTAVITQATGNGTTITYTGFNNFTAGMNVTIVGLTVFSGASLDIVGAVVASASSSQFTVTNTTVGVSNGGGSAYNYVMPDLIGGLNGYIAGTASFPSNGAIIYVNSGCVDLANGSSKETGYVVLGTGVTLHGGIDLWVLGQGLAGSQPIEGMNCTVGGTSYPVTFSVTAFGFLRVALVGISGSVTGTQRVNDGYWHHIGLVCDASGNSELYCDGTFTSLSTLGVVSGFTPNSSAPGLTIGGIDNLTACYIDEVIVSNQTSLATLQTEVLNRFVAGSLLQLPVKASGSQVSSGDRIAEILAIAGFGKVTSGALTLNSNLYYINNGSAWSGYSSSNGFVNVQPFYWDAPVFSSTALDLIYQVCDTDIGRFWQKGDATFAFHNQKFFGSWEWDTITGLSSTSTTLTYTCTNTLIAGETVCVVDCYPLGYNGIWTVASATSTQFTVSATSNPGSGTLFGNAGGWSPTSYTPTGDHAWSDDGSTSYPYDGPSLNAPRDEADVWTQIAITPQAGIDQIFENVFAQGIYGYNSLVKSGTLHDSLTHALSTACYLGVLFRSPLQRVQSVTLKAEFANGANNGALVNCQIDQVVSFKRSPPNSSVAGQINRNMVVESRDTSFDAASGKFDVTYTLDPYPIRG